jgi:nucleotide-binding universal stress UspA family protein
LWAAAFSLFVAAAVSNVRILVATDLSEQAAAAQARAVLLAKAHHASIGLLHVVRGTPKQRPGPSLHAPQGPNRSGTATLLGALHAQADSLSATYGIDVRLALSSGRPGDEIMRHAVVADCALIVVGAKPKPILQRLLFGSTTTRLIRRSPLPLLLVQQAPQASYRRLFAAVDFSPCALNAVKMALQLAPESALTAFHAVESLARSPLHLRRLPADPSELDRRQTLAQAHEKMDRFLTAAGVDSRANGRIGYGNRLAVLTRGMKRENPDLLVLGKRMASAVKRLAFQTLPEELTSTATCDVLLVPDTQHPRTRL